MHAARRFYTEHTYEIVLFSILLAAFFLRFFDLTNRFGLAYDQARDLLVAGYALSELKFPLIGPFASAGQFVYGPQWYWFLMGFLAITPGFFLGPWVLLGVLYCLCVFLMMKTGEMIGGKTLAVIVGVLIAVSPGAIAQSLNLSSPSMVGVLSLVSIFFFVRYLKKQKMRDGFFLAFIIGTAIMVHFQAIGLVSLLIAGGILGKRSIKYVLLLLGGFMLPFLPLIYFDFTNNFFESRNVLDYYLTGRHRIQYSNRWLTYITVFWPNSWARITGGQLLLGYVGFFSVFLIALRSFIREKTNKIVLGLSSVFIVNFMVLRYYNGEVFDSYLVFLHGIILLMTSLLILYLYRIKRFIGIIVLALFVLGSLQIVYSEAKGSENTTYQRSARVSLVLEQEFPGKAFSVYDYKYMSPQVSLPIALYLRHQGLLSDSGQRIGITGHVQAASMSAHPIIDPALDVAVLDLSSSKSADLMDAGWGRVNSPDVHRTTVLWYTYQKQ